jgi:alpha-2-macroglobulin
VEKRSGGHFWRSTRDTALATAALADFMGLRKADFADCRVEVYVDGKLAKTVALGRDNFLVDDHRLVLQGRQLPPGSHRFLLKKAGKGDVHFSSRLRYVTQEDVVAASGQGIVLHRDYYRLSRDGNRTRIRLGDGDHVAVGEILETELSVRADHEYEYLAFEDIKPAGCEPTQLQSGAAWFGNEWATVELRDDRVLFFVQSLSPGDHVLRYRLRAEVPGQFLALPANGFAMYNPEIRANSSDQRFRIVDAK